MPFICIEMAFAKTALLKVYCKFFDVVVVIMIVCDRKADNNICRNIFLIFCTLRPYFIKNNEYTEQ